MSSENHRNRLGTKPPDWAGVISSFIPQAEHLVLSLGELGGWGGQRWERCCLSVWARTFWFAQ